jgi:hypothetical protein
MQKCFICDKPCSVAGTITCSQGCHEELMNRLVAQWGEFKKVVRASTGVAYKVPTRDIIDHGIKEKDLDQYPLWEQAHG